uniref:EB1 C-terminal domain-containing protein n=1 Tax=Glossina morsitans morsitans TaxID=37546 RepID=A0A1B0G0Z3_GLOMM
MDMLFPNSVPITRVKFFTNSEHESIQNFQIFQTSFKKINAERIIPIDKLCTSGTAQMGYGTTHAKASPSSDAAAIAIQQRFPSMTTALTAHSTVSSSVALGSVTRAAQRANSTIEKYNENSTTAANQRIDELSIQIMCMRLNLEGLEKERDLYFSRLLDIKIFCKEVNGGESHPLVQKIFEIVYAPPDKVSPDDDGY